MPISLRLFISFGNICFVRNNEQIIISNSFKKDIYKSRWQTTQTLGITYSFKIN